MRPGSLERGGLFAATLVFAAAGFTAPWYAPRPADLAFGAAWQLVVGLGCAAAGLVVWPAARVVGRLLVGSALLLFTGPVLMAVDRPHLANAAWALVLLILLPVAQLRVAPMRWRRPIEIVLVVVGGSTAITTGAGLFVVALSLAITAGLVLLIAGGLLFEASAGEDRRRVLWLILGFLLAVPPSLLLFVAKDNDGYGSLVLGLIAATLSLAVPLGTAVALLNPRLVDVRTVIERLTVFTVMFALAAAVYVGGETTVLALTGQPPPRWFRVLLAMVVAVGFHPTMRWVRTSVDEMLFGGRADPVDTLARIGTHLTAGSSPPEWLDTLRVALAVQGLALRQGGAVVAATGTLDGTVNIVTELRAGAEPVGELVTALPADHLRPAPTTTAVLNLVAVPLAQALYADRLTEELRASRGRVVTALEEERRRMRRDLHDGLGPTLTGIAYSADAAANLLRANPSEATVLLRQLRTDAGDAIADVRRIVYALRPRALDELGLVGAVRQQVGHLHTADGRVLTVTIHAPDPLPDLPAAVEVAAYRVAVEAVTNVARHAGVATATVTFTTGPGPVLHLTVRDPGLSTQEWTAGVGLRSMRERAEQIGGTFAIDRDADGTRVTVTIPLALA